ncbi:MAG: gluconate 2-dehydrogenase subunit 3 family protein [Bryobacter sp.]|jgi:hypothetical protein|nr:gluconate 2-dehydrogenase subunit 3 family protein [Bryobacter sp. CoA8 C33]
MKRRRFFQSALAAPAAGNLLAQQSGPAGSELPKLEISPAEAVGEYTPRFFSAGQFASLARLAEVLMPGPEGGVGAPEAKAAEFLDFLLSQSLPERQQLYLKGLDALNAEARRKQHQSFATVSLEQANALLEPLRKPWSYEPPADLMTRFLQAAKADVRTATINSREFNAGQSAGSRRPAGIGLYWKAIE